MKTMLTICTILFCISYLYSCSNNKSLQCKFNTFKNTDFSEFQNTNILYRKGVYFIKYHDTTYVIKRHIFSKQIYYTKDVYNNRENTLPQKDITIIENILKSFDKLNIQSLSVDNKANIYISVPWANQCTYYFLKLSPKNTLIEIKKQYYQYYKDGLYIDKKCAE